MGTLHSVPLFLHEHFAGEVLEGFAESDEDSILRFDLETPALDYLQLAVALSSMRGNGAVMNTLNEYGLQKNISE